MKKEVLQVMERTTLEHLNPTEDPPRGCQTQEGKAAAALRVLLPRGIPDCGVATRRDPIPFETRDERRDPKSI